jgi:hypothetical protein
MRPPQRSTVEPRALNGPFRFEFHSTNASKLLHRIQSEPLLLALTTVCAVPKARLVCSSMTDLGSGPGCLRLSVCANIAEQTAGYVSDGEPPDSPSHGFFSSMTQITLGTLSSVTQPPAPTQPCSSFAQRSVNAQPENHLRAIHRDHRPRPEVAMCNGKPPSEISRHDLLHTCGTQRPRREMFAEVISRMFGHAWCVPARARV